MLATLTMGARPSLGARSTMGACPTSVRLPAPPGACLTSARLPAPPGRARRVVLCSADAPGGDECPSNTDWDRAWQRWQLEGDGGPRGEGANAVADALSQLASAEANVRAAREEADSAADEKARLQAELDGIRRLSPEKRLSRRLPYEYEEIDALYKLIADDETFVRRLAVRACLAILVLSLLLRWRTQGFESVAGCVVMPLVCVASSLGGPPGS